MPFKHALIIGGTGMLGEATRRIAAQSSTVTLVARRPDRFELTDDARVERVAIDYHRTDELISQLRRAASDHGDFDMALTWVHSSGEESLLRVADLLAEQSGVPRLVDVQSSAAAQPGGESRRHRYLRSIEGVSYQRVVLGFVVEGAGSRWLTDDEISTGVLEAVASQATERIVGVVEPWDLRP